MSSAPSPQYAKEYRSSPFFAPNSGTSRSKTPWLALNTISTPVMAVTFSPGFKCASGFRLAVQVEYTVTAWRAVHLPNWQPSPGQALNSTLGRAGGVGMATNGATNGFCSCGGRELSTRIAPTACKIARVKMAKATGMEFDSTPRLQSAWSFCSHLVTL